MGGWIVVPCLLKLREEFNEIAPNRPKGADGTIGDEAHADRVSDHNPDETGAVPIRDVDKTNEVHALDITTFDGLDEIVMYILALCREGKEKRLRYIIWRGYIYHVNDGWKRATYDGSDKHFGHAHFSASYETVREADTSSWFMEAFEMDAKEVWEYNTGTAKEPYRAVGRLVTVFERTGEIREDVNALIDTVAKLAADVKVIKDQLVP